MPACSTIEGIVGAGAAAPTPSHQQRTDRGSTHDDRPRLPARALRRARAHRLRSTGTGGLAPAAFGHLRGPGRPAGYVWADVAQGGTPHVVVTAHNDQIGLIVTYVDEKGFVSFDKIGGVDAQLLPGRSLVVHTSSGPVNGVVGRKPSHKMSKEERAKAPEITDQWLDIGA